MGSCLRAAPPFFGGFMITLQRMADIAAAYDCPMSDALLRAVIVKAYETGEDVVIPKRHHRSKVSYDRKNDPFHAEARECMRQSHGVTWRG